MAAELWEATTRNEPGDAAAISAPIATPGLEPLTPCRELERGATLRDSKSLGGFSRAVIVVGGQRLVGRSGPANETLATNDNDGAREAGSSELSELELPASWDDEALRIRILRGATLATLETELVDRWTREHSKAPFQPDDWDFMTGKWVFARSFRQRRAAMQAAVSGP